jgi:hypothetical protein
MGRTIQFERVSFVEIAFDAFRLRGSGVMIGGVVHEQSTTKTIP